MDKTTRHVKAVGDRFEEIRHDEMKHREAFRKVVEKLAKNPLRAG